MGWKGVAVDTTRLRVPAIIARSPVSVIRSWTLFILRAEGARGLSSGGVETSRALDRGTVDGGARKALWASAATSALGPGVASRGAARASRLAGLGVAVTGSVVDFLISSRTGEACGIGVWTSIVSSSSTSDTHGICRIKVNVSGVARSRISRARGALVTHRALHADRWTVLFLILEVALTTGGKSRGLVRVRAALGVVIAEGASGLTRIRVGASRTEERNTVSSGALVSLGTLSAGLIAAKGEEATRAGCSGS
jgi:hypothetical protein